MTGTLSESVFLLERIKGVTLVHECVLLIGHGSRDHEGNEEFLEFVKMINNILPMRWVEACFLEFAEPDIVTGIAACARQGAKRIVAVPLILLAASHVKEEIPEYLDKGRDLYPEIDIVYGRHVGQHEALVDLLKERFYEAVAIQQEASNALGDTAIVLLGRGSSDPDANGDLYKIARLLWERTGVLTVEVCFSGITTPLLPEGVKRAIALGARRIVVVPYFLFTGVLIKRMHKLLAKLGSEFPEVSMTMAEYFGYHQHLVDAVVERIEEVASA